MDAAECQASWVAQRERALEAGALLDDIRRVAYQGGQNAASRMRNILLLLEPSRVAAPVVAGPTFWVEGLAACDEHQRWFLKQEGCPECLAPDHLGCAAVLVDTAASQPRTGGEIEAFEQPNPPASRSGYEPDRFVCPHGAVIWVLPTYRQISAWEASS